MKYSFDWMEIERRRKEWIDILEEATVPIQTFEGELHNPNLDESDVVYIKYLCEVHPKLERLIPEIIKEAMLFGDNVFSQIENFPTPTLFLSVTHCYPLWLSIL